GGASSRARAGSRAVGCRRGFAAAVWGQRLPGPSGPHALDPASRASFHLAQERGGRRFGKPTSVFVGRMLPGMLFVRLFGPVTDWPYCPHDLEPASRASFQLAQERGDASANVRAWL